MRHHGPLPSEVRAARARAGLTLAQSAAIVHTSVRAWQQWESGARRMHPAFWALYQLRTAQTTAKTPSPPRS